MLVERSPEVSVAIFVLDLRIDHDRDLVVLLAHLPARAEPAADSAPKARKRKPVTTEPLFEMARRAAEADEARTATATVRNTEKPDDFKLPQTEVILITGYGTIENAVRGMREGAFDYVTKPVLDDEMVMVVERALEAARLRTENADLRAKLSADGLSNEEQNLDEQVKQTDVGFVAGAAIDFAHIVIDARYIWGLTNINDDSTDTSTIKNRVAQITLGFRF